MLSGVLVCIGMYGSVHPAYGTLKSLALPASALVRACSREYGTIKSTHFLLPLLLGFPAIQPINDAPDFELLFFLGGSTPITIGIWPPGPGRIGIPPGGPIMPPLNCGGGGGMPIPPAPAGLALAGRIPPIIPGCIGCRV